MRADTGFMQKGINILDEKVHRHDIMHAKAYTSSVRYNVRTNSGEICYARTMDETWRFRLLAEIDRSELSGREICKRAGVGSSFISDLKNAGKSPKAENVVKVADALGVSLTWIFAGVTLSQEAEEIARIWAMLPSESQDALLALARQLRERLQPSKGDAGRHPADPE